MLITNTESIAGEFLEISSEQRSNIILHLRQQSTTITNMAKKIDSTVPEVHRNFKRLEKTGIIKKNTSGEYDLTQYGDVICEIFLPVSFMVKNKKFFLQHNLGDLPHKFIQRIGVLFDSHLVTGHVMVMEQWNDIYSNSKKYIKNTLIEASYDLEMVKLLMEKVTQVQK